MILSDSGRQQLRRLLQTGMDAGSARLTRISGAVWQVLELSLRQGSAAELRLPPGERPRHTAALFTMPGGAVLVAFPAPSATSLAQAFMKALDRGPESLKDQEDDAVAEIANMMVNPALNLLGDAMLRTIFLSSPELRRGELGQLDEAALAKLPSARDAQTLRADLRLGAPGLGASCSVVLLFDAGFTDHLAEALGA